eukprot:TRINITY_DN56127_c0_g1_i1.p1 TRINITY_DN56127_c0_g1~~TRINITY_DN56127_c0_g1_i1.p1  ORF type:complete len:340 (-),score=42.63 TRINITY_DN56127_c0_g1_i1:167-1186(-)
MVSLEIIDREAAHEPGAQFPMSFRALDAGWVNTRADGTETCNEDTAISLQVRCQCQACVVQVLVGDASADVPPVMVRCHCRGCRRFHCSAFAVFVKAVESHANLHLGDCVRQHQDQCAHLGLVNRLFCRKCFSKLATISLDEENRPCSPTVYLSLGTVDDSCVPPVLAHRWRKTFDDWEVGASSPWWNVMPTSIEEQPMTSHLRGGCACGACAYTAMILPGQAQHCYCNLCRRLSGAASMTWIPCCFEGFQWTRTDGLILIRTTVIGQRHFCRHCGGVLTIVYDSDPLTIWPVAGSLDDDTLPEWHREKWYRVIHICCSMMQPWYELPDDGLPRLKYAG